MPSLLHSSLSFFSLLQDLAILVFLIIMLLTTIKLSFWLRLNWNWNSVTVSKLPQPLNPSSSCHSLNSGHFSYLILIYLMNLHPASPSLPLSPPLLSSILLATTPNSASSCYSLHRVEYHQVDSTHIQVSLSPEPRSNPDTWSRQDGSLSP